MTIRTNYAGGFALFMGIFTLACADLPDLPTDIDAEPGAMRVGDAGGPDLFSADSGRPDVRLADAEGLVDVSVPADMSPAVQDAGVDLAFELDAGPPVAQGPVLYPAGRTHSPVTNEVVASIAAVSERRGAGQPDVFMKVGASSTVSRNTLHCFAGERVDLAAHAVLEDTLNYFMAGDAGGSTPFDRVTVAARVGHSARWVIDGDPSPLDAEIEAIRPGLALVHYGTNDMGLGSTYMSAMHGFHEHMMTLITQLMDDGIVPVLTGISPRGDRASADLWVDAYNTVIRGMAQQHALPFIDLKHATLELDGYGLSGDGIHLNRYPGGACILTEDGLEYGYNVRNLIMLEALDRVRRARDEGEVLDRNAPRLEGAGTYEAPFVISQLPFTDSRDTRNSPTRRFDAYSACSDANEQGPEYVYRYETDRRVHLRAMVLDRGDVDIDLHLLDETATDRGCLARNHTHLEFTLDPGVYHFVLDTFANRTGEELAGPYLFAVLECNEGDADCAEVP